jgi:hypothetical protein
MVTAIEYRAMALQHHRWAGMCRSPQSREDHFRLEKELLALADSEERLHAMRGAKRVSSPQPAKGSAVKHFATGEPTRCAREPGLMKNATHSQNSEKITGARLNRGRVQRAAERVALLADGGWIRTAQVMAVAYARYIAQACVTALRLSPDLARS